jgi:hypothetical protein
MMRFYLFLLVNILLFSCSKKDADEFVAYPNDPQNDTVWVRQPTITSPVYKIPELLSFPPKEDSFDAAAGAVIQFSDVLNITFPPTGFKFVTGTAVTGKVKVQVTHLHKKGDFIRFALQTASFDKWLSSGGAIFIRVTKEGQELLLDPTKNITVVVREISPVNNMKVFYGEQVLQPSVALAINSTFTWAISTDVNDVNVFNGQDASGAYRASQFSSKRLNWISWNYFGDATQTKTRTTAVLPPNLTNKNTMVFAVLKDSKTVMQLEGHGSSKVFDIQDIPLNKNITLISLSRIGDYLYLGSKEARVEKNERVNITPQRKTKAEIEQFLDAL